MATVTRRTWSGKGPTGRRVRKTAWGFSTVVNGQSVLNGVVMVALFSELREGGMAPEKAVVSGAITRLRTVLMTALLASLGLLPMALSTGIGAETQKPLAVVVIGGLVSAMLLVLFVLPVIYVMLYRREERTTV